MNLPDNRVFDAFVRISDLPKESWSQSIEASSELSDSEKNQLRLLLEEADRTKNRVEEPAVDERFKRALEEREITILRQLGAGGMGVVFEGFEKSTGRRVAVKRLRTDGGIIEGDLSREIGHLSRVHHTNVCSLYFAGTFPVNKKNRPYFVMEFIDGVPIDVYLSVNVISASQFLELLLQLVDGLQYAHSLGVVHRDLKPSNIMVTRDSVLKILDFGISDFCHTTSSGEEFEPVGTPGYASPSQMAGGVPNQRMDIHAFGVIVKDLLDLPNLANEAGVEFCSRVREVALSCFEQETRNQLSLFDIRKRIESLSKEPVRRKLMPPSVLLCSAVIAAGSFLFWVLQKSESSDSISEFVKVDQSAQAVLFAGAARSSVEYAHYGLPQFEYSPVSGQIESEQQIMLVYMNSCLLKSLGDPVRSATFLDNSLGAVQPDLKATSVTYHAALLNLAKNNYSLSRYDSCLENLRELSTYKLHSLHDTCRKSLLVVLSSFIDQAMPFTEEETLEISAWGDGDVALTNLIDNLDGPLGSTALMLDEIDDVVDAFAVFDIQGEEVPEKAKELINQAVLKFKSSEGGTGFRTDRYLHRWEAWLLYWSGNKARAYDLIKLRSESIRKKSGHSNPIALAADFELLSFMAHYQVMNDDPSLLDKGLSLARRMWILSDEVCIDTDYLKLNIGMELIELLLSKAAVLSTSDMRSSRIEIGREAVAVASEVQLLASHHFSKTDDVWVELLVDQASALALADEKRASQIKFSEATENVSDQLVLEEYRLLYSQAVWASENHDAAIDLLLMNISNADSVQNSQSHPLRFRPEVISLAGVLDTMARSPKHGTSIQLTLEKLNADRNFLRCLECIEQQFKRELDLRERPYALAQLADLYIEIQRPLDASRILCESLETDLSEMMGRSSDPVFFLKPDDVGWWEWDIELMLKAVRMSSDDPSQMKLGHSYGVRFIELADSAREQTAWFDVPVFDDLVSCVSDLGAEIHE